MRRARSRTLLGDTDIDAVLEVPDAQFTRQTRRTQDFIHALRRSVIMVISGRERKRSGITDVPTPRLT